MSNLQGRFLLGLRLLILVLEEDCAAVLAAHIRPLAILGGRVVRREKQAQQVLVAQHGGVIGDLDRLGVPGVAAAHLAVIGVGHAATDVAADHALYPTHILEDRLGTPEAATSHDCRLGCHRGSMARARRPQGF